MLFSGFINRIKLMVVSQECSVLGRKVHVACCGGMVGSSIVEVGMELEISFHFGEYVTVYQSQVYTILRYRPAHELRASEVVELMTFTGVRWPWKLRWWSYTILHSISAGWNFVQSAKKHSTYWREGFGFRTTRTLVKMVAFNSKHNAEHIILYLWNSYSKTTNLW